MQDPLFFRALPYRPSFGERRLNSDLARFSLDLTLVRTGPRKAAHLGPYPSPPMSESPRTSGYPSLSRTGHPEAGDSRCESNPRRQEWDEHQQTRRPIAEAVSAPPQYPPLPHPETHSVAQGQHPTSMPAQRSPFLAQAAAFTPPRAPKRPKAHVLSACVNCKKAHLSCDVQRPCRRCIATNKEHSCVDVQHKKRGRPRLRDEREPRFDAFETAVLNPQSSLRLPLGSPVPSPANIPSIYRPGAHRVLKSQSGGQPAAPRHLEHASLRDANIVSPNSHGSTGFQSSTPERRPYSGLAVAYLNMDLIVAKASSNFIDAVSAGVRDLVGKNLFDMIGTGDREKLYRLKRQMQEERDSREPAYLPPIYGESEIQAIQGVHESDIARVTSGSHDRTEDLTFRLPDGRYSKFQVQLKLAKTSVFFAVLVLPTSNYPPEFQPALPQGGQYRQPMVQPTYKQTTALPSYGQPSHAQPFPSGPHDRSSAYYNQCSLGPIESPSGDRRSQVQPDPAYGPMAKYPSASLAPSQLVEQRTMPTSGVTPQQPRLYASPCEGPSRGLQLPPLRGVTGPADTQSAEGKTERDVGTGAQSEQQEGGRKNRRDRIAVQEMLE